MFKLNYRTIKSGLQLGLLQNQNFAVFAITNSCGNKCKMCSIWKSKKKTHISEDKFKDCVDVLTENNYNIMLLTGGDALYHPRIFSLLNYLDEKDVIYSLCTNATNISFHIAERLSKHRNLLQVLVSLDSSDPEVFSRIRGNPNILLEVMCGIGRLKGCDIDVLCIFTLLKDNLPTIRKTIALLREHDLKMTICPTFNLNKNPYDLGNEKSVIPSNSEQAETMKRILEMKNNGDNLFYDPKQFFEDGVSWFEGKRPRFPCMAGKHICFVDWNGNLFRCFNASRQYPLTAEGLAEMGNEFDRCEKCYVGCFRGPSIPYHSRIENVKIFFENIRVPIKTS